MLSGKSFRITTARQPIGIKLSLTRVRVYSLVEWKLFGNHLKLFLLILLQPLLDLVVLEFHQRYRLPLLALDLLRMHERYRQQKRFPQRGDSGEHRLSEARNIKLLRSDQEHESTSAQDTAESFSRPTDTWVDVAHPERPSGSERCGWHRGLAAPVRRTSVQHQPPAPIRYLFKRFF